MPSKNSTKDPKVSRISLAEFFKNYHYFSDIKIKDFYWENNRTPCECETYFKFTGNKLIAISYGYVWTNFGCDTKEKLESIQVAIRDGKTEYDLIESELSRLIEKQLKNKANKKLEKRISNIKKMRKMIPNFRKVEVNSSRKSFSEYLADAGYKTEATRFNHKYVVFDVETNGTRKKNDDLLSLTIYNPFSGICYNRFFPLDMQPTVLTGFINGISDEQLNGATHITQEEMDELISYFDLKNSIVLSYSGGKGTFDPGFVVNYCKRHGVSGFENLIFENIKSVLPASPFGSAGQLTKDNLCEMFGIEGISKMHSSISDCVLEWKLFEKLIGELLFFVKNHLFRYNEKYIIPITYGLKRPELLRFAGAKFPSFEACANLIFQYHFPKSTLKHIKKFPTNITGVTIENAIDSMLGAVREDNRDFLKYNFNQLDFIGSVKTDNEEIPVSLEDDGTIQAVNPLDYEFVEDVNDVTKTIKDNLSATIQFIKDNIFFDSKILSQEMIISPDRKLLALCDLSSDKSILEIKTMEVVIKGDTNDYVMPDTAKQLYCEKNGRDVYLMSVVFDKHYSERLYKEIIDDLRIDLYKIEFKFDK